MPALKTEAARLRGRLESWRDVRDGWGYGAIVDDASGATVKITGKTIGARVGESLELVGFWSDHASFGRQFKITSCVASAPQTDAGVIAWVTDTFPGVGAVRARALLDHFGGVEQLWHAIETTPERLAEINGITPGTAERIHEAYVDGKADRDCKIALRGWGLTDKQIARCLADPPEGAGWTLVETVARVRTDPFQLAQYVHGFGFLRADDVARRAGMPHDAPERIRAALDYVLEQRTLDGHCYLSGAQLQAEAVELLHVPPKLVGRQIYASSARKRIVRRRMDWRCYSARMERAESKCALAIARCLVAAAATNANDTRKDPKHDNDGPTFH